MLVDECLEDFGRVDRRVFYGGVAQKADTAEFVVVSHQLKLLFGFFRFRLAAHFFKQMAECGYGMAVSHARTAVAHYQSNMRAARGCITMVNALPARWLAVTFRAFFETLKGVVDKMVTLDT